MLVLRKKLNQILALQLHSIETDLPFTCVRSIPFSAANFFARGLTNNLPFGPAGVAGRVADGVEATGWGVGGTGVAFLKKLQIVNSPLQRLV